MENFSQLSKQMRVLIESCIENAVEFVGDMNADLSDSEREALTIGQIRTQVSDTSKEFFGQQLDPNGWDCPEHIAICIDEKVGAMSVHALMSF